MSAKKGACCYSYHGCGASQGTGIKGQQLSVRIVASRRRTVFAYNNIFPTFCSDCCGPYTCKRPSPVFRQSVVHSKRTLAIYCTILNRQTVLVRHPRHWTQNYRPTIPSLRFSEPADLAITCRHKWALAKDACKCQKTPYEIATNAEFTEGRRRTHGPRLGSKTIMLKNTDP